MAPIVEVTAVMGISLAAGSLICVRDVESSSHWYQRLLPVAFKLQKSR